MQPSNSRLIREVVAALSDRVAPAVAHDRWAASELRSIGVVLAFVASRLDHEQRLLHDDNARLRRLLSDLGVTGITEPQPGDPAEDEEEASTALRSALEALMPQLHDGNHPEQLAAVRSYLLESALEEEVIYGPLTERRPF